MKHIQQISLVVKKYLTSNPGDTLTPHGLAQYAKRVDFKFARMKTQPLEKLMENYLSNYSIEEDDNKTSEGEAKLEDATTAVEIDPQVDRQKEEKGEPDKKRKAVDPSTTKKKKFKAETPTLTLASMGGIEHCLEEILELIAMPILHPEIYVHTGVEPARGILLHGPPGCGKTMLAKAIAGELQVPFLQISAPSIVSGMSGESEKAIRDLFEEARASAPCILFLDEIDAITPKRETAQREMERRIVAQLLLSMDELSWEKTQNKPVIFIGATNRPDALDPALRRAGRFDREISLGVPDEVAREQILMALFKKLRLDAHFDLKMLARATPGFVGADLNALTTAAGMAAVKRIFKQLGNAEAGTIETIGEEMQVVTEQAMEKEGILSSLRDGSSGSLELKEIAAFLKSHPEPLGQSQLDRLSITMEDFWEALPQIQPSSKREGFATVPDVTWQDIGALGAIREELRLAIVEQIKHPEWYARVGINKACGVLLWGPPGCGKTLLAKAVANESKANFISIKGPELLNKYVGESERAIRQVFARARVSQPCVVFFDELDALCAKRDDSQSEASARVVNTLLTELDGASARKQVFVVAATNRPDMIDHAMLRPGRLDKLLFVDIPSAQERQEILIKLCTKTPLAEDVCLTDVANHPRAERMTGADLAAVVREAAVACLKETIMREEEEGEITVNSRHFQQALDKVAPSVSVEDQRRYEVLKKRLT